MKPTVSMTKIDWTRRRMMNAIMLGTGGDAGTGKPSLYLDEAQREEIVRELNQPDVVPRGPDDGLLMKRNVTELLLVDLHRLADQRQPLLPVGLHLDHVRQLVDLLVGVAPDVEEALAAFVG